MPRLIDADALLEKRFKMHSEFIGTVSVVATEDIDNAPAIDPESLRPHGRCRYCSPEDGGGVEWDLEDIEVSMTLRCGKLTISNSFGDEADVPIRYCPICGAKMDLEE